MRPESEAASRVPYTLGRIHKLTRRKCTICNIDDQYLLPCTLRSEIAMGHCLSGTSAKTCAYWWYVCVTFLLIDIEISLYEFHDHKVAFSLKL